MQVYLITNKINGTQYVRQTTHALGVRWSGHKSEANNRKRWPLHRAMAKYGIENFTIETLHVCEAKEEMDFAEIFYVTLLNTKWPNGYNLSDGGESGARGCHWTDEAKAQRSIISQARWDANPHLRIELAERMKGNSNTKGRVRPKEEVLKVSAALKDNQYAKGVKQSAEQKKKRSKDQTGIWAERRVARTHCSRGHVYTAETAYVYPDGIRMRCRLCKAENDLNSDRKNRDKINARKRARRKALRNIREGRVTS